MAAFAVLGVAGCAGLGASKAVVRPTKVELSGTAGVMQLATRKPNAADELTVAAQGPGGHVQSGIPASKAGGVRLQFQGGYAAGVINADESLAVARNSRLVIAPYKFEGT